MNQEVEIFFPPHGQYLGLDPTVLKQRIVTALKDRVEAAYCFGSLARGDGDFNSDIDLILVKNTTAGFPQRAFEFLDLMDIYPDMDILVYTPQEFLNLTRQPSIGFWQEVVGQMQRLV